jgi:hypothetical protein
MQCFENVDGQLIERVAGMEVKRGEKGVKAANEYMYEKRSCASSQIAAIHTCSGSHCSHCFNRSQT